jgi:alpha-tubulin suppressor-like RCC1 family protein
MWAAQRLARSRRATIGTLRGACRRRSSSGSGDAAPAAAAKVFTLGRGESGQLGSGDLMSATTPSEVDVPSSGAVVAIACGMSHSACLTDSGELWTFGSNFSQQLGHDEHSGVFTVFEEVRVPHCRAQARAR